MPLDAHLLLPFDIMNILFEAILNPLKVTNEIPKFRIARPVQQLQWIDTSLASSLEGCLNISIAVCI